MQESSETLAAALARIREGDALGAEVLVADAVARAREASGDASMAYALAQYVRGQLLVSLGDVQRAVGALQAAFEVPPHSDEDHKLHLTIGMNLGELLAHIGERERAVEVLRQGLVARESFYGKDHAGYAYGLEALAEVTLLTGDAPVAAALADDALRIFWEDGNARVAAALGLAAISRAALADPGVILRPEDWLPRFDALPDELQAQAVRDLLRRAERLPADASLKVLEQLQPHVESKQGATHSWSLQLLAAITNVARRAEDPIRRIAAFEALEDRYGRLGDTEQQVRVLQGLALAHADAGHDAEAEGAYRRAISIATEAGAPEGAAASWRNYGLWQLERAQSEAGIASLSRAVKLAREIGGSVLGRALVAHAVQVQHAGDLDAARVELEEAVELLEPAEPDAVVARSHLRAITTGGADGHGEMSEALSEALREMVLPQVPEGLLADIAYRPGDDGTLQLDVQLAREPEEAELELLDRVIRQAVATLQQRSRDAGFAR